MAISNRRDDGITPLLNRNEPTTCWEKSCRILNWLCYTVLILALTGGCGFCSICAYNIYSQVFVCSDGMHYFENIKSMNCTISDAVSWFQHHFAFGGLFLLALAWNIGLSIQALPWRIIELAGAFIVTYPLLQNKIEVKARPELCLEINSDLSDDCYLIQEAVINVELFTQLNGVCLVLLIMLITISLVGFCLSFVNTLSAANKEQTNQTLNIPLENRSPINNIDHFKELHAKLDTIINLIQRNHGDNDVPISISKTIKQVYKYGYHTIKLNICQIIFLWLKVFFSLTAIICGVAVVAYLGYLLLGPHSFSSKAVIITDLFNPIKNDVKFFRKQLLHILSLFCMIYLSRALAFSPVKRPTRHKWKSFGTFIRKVFWDYKSPLTHMTNELLHPPRRRRRASTS